MQNEEKIVHTDASTPYRRVLSATSLTKDYIYNHMNQEIGSLKELMIDVPSGRVAYVVLAVGGFLGLGERLFAIPWQLLTLDEDRKCFVMDVQKEQLERAPSLNPDNWPDMTDASWGTTVDSYWETPAAASGVSDYGIEAGRWAGGRKSTSGRAAR